MKNYFPHDHHARSDKKLINLMRVMGMSGIGLYWCIVEMLYEENGWLKLADLDSIAYDLRTEIKTINALIYDFNLFFVDGEKFSSKSVQYRLKIIEDKSSIRSKAAKARWEKYKEDANALQKDSKCNAIKRKEIKLNESKLKDINSFRITPQAPSFFFFFLYPKGETLLALVAKIKAKRKKVAQKKEKIQPHLFSASPFADLSKFLAAFPTEQYSKINLEAYHGIIADWSASKGAKKIDWIAFARNWMRSDHQNKKLILKGTEPASSKIQERVGVMQEVQQKRKYDQNGNRIKEAA